MTVVYPCERHLEATRRLPWERVVDIAEDCRECRTERVAVAAPEAPSHADGTCGCTDPYCQA